MAKKRRRVRVPARAVPTKPPEPELVEEVAEDANGDYTKWTVADLRAECEERDLTTTGRKSTLVKRLLADDEGAPEEAPAPPAKTAPKKTAPKRRKKPKEAPEPEPVELAQGTLATLFDAMAPGLFYVITRIDEGTWQFSIAGEGAAAPAAVAAPKGRGLRGEAFHREVLTKEYYAFFNVDAGTGKAWSDMTVEEKYAFAEAQGVAWEEADDDKVDLMRMVRAMMEHFDITKYKDEYKSKAQREALR